MYSIGLFLFRLNSNNVNYVVTFSEADGETSKGALNNAVIAFLIIWSNNVQIIYFFSELQ